MKTYIIWLVVIKLLFIFLSVAYRIHPNNRILYYREKIETVFFVSMALLLVYLFNPRFTPVISTQERYLLFLFGIIIVIKTDFRQFIA